MKRLTSVLLVMIMLVSMVTVSVSAYSWNESGVQTVEEAIAVYEDNYGVEVETNRYYFLMPNGSNGDIGDEMDNEYESYGKYAQSWYNEFTTTAGIYWWDSGVADPPAWIGYVMSGSDPMDPDVYYADVPVDVTSIVFNNGVDGGTDSSEDIYYYGASSVNIGSEYYDPGESPNYPEGTESFDNMIYVIDPDLISISELSLNQTCGGEWYYYYGSGCYGFTQGGDHTDCLRADHYDENGVHTASFDDSKTYINADGTYYEVEPGQTYTYNFYLQCSSRLSCADATVYYDDNGLQFLPDIDQYGDYTGAEFPNLYSPIYNFGISGEVIFNTSTYSGYYMSFPVTDTVDEDNIFATFDFKVTGGPGVYDISTYMSVLGDENINAIVRDNELLDSSVTVRYISEIEGVPPVYNPPEDPTVPDGPCSPDQVVPSSIDLEVGGEYRVTLDDESVRMYFTPSISGYYTISSDYYSGDPVCVLYDESGDEIASSDDYSGRDFYIEEYLDAGEEYCYLVRGYSYYPLDTMVYFDAEFEEITTDVEYDIYIPSEQRLMFVFTPEYSGEYTFTSISNGDTKCYLYDENGDTIASDDDSGDGNNFEIVCNLVEGRTYAFQVFTYSGSALSCSILLTAGDIEQEIFAEQDYVIEVPLNKSVRLKFTPDASANYIIESFSGSDAQCTLYDANGVKLAFDDDSGESLDFCFAHYLQAGETYYYQINGYNGRALTCPIFLTRKVTDIYADSYYTVEIAQNQSEWLSFVPLTSAEYTIESFADEDVRCYLYDSNGDELGYDDDAGEGLNFCLTHYLTAGKTYYYQLSGYKGVSSSCQIVVSASGDTHTHVLETIEGFEATCENDGITDQIYCTLCYEIIQEAEVIPAKGHSVIEDSGYPATCTDNGRTSGSHCEDCGEVFEEQEVIPAYGHDYRRTVVKPTCTLNGYTINVCANCDYTYTSDTVPSTGHNEVALPDVPATCQHEGSKGGSYCSKCQAILSESQVVPITGHSIVCDNNAVPATCTESGLTDSYSCKYCNMVNVKQRVIQPLGHDYQKIEGYPATDYEEGLTDGVGCMNCGDMLIEQTVIPAKNFMLGDVNGDKGITVMDATAVQRHIAKLIELTGREFKAGDTTKDGKISVMDATAIQRFIAKLITEF